ncbi:MAG: hypothetical protein ACP5QR_16105 [Rhizomicrobium sp.]
MLGTVSTTTCAFGKPAIMAPRKIGKFSLKNMAATVLASRCSGTSGSHQPFQSSPSSGWRFDFILRIRIKEKARKHQA